MVLCHFRITAQLHWFSTLSIDQCASLTGNQWAALFFLRFAESQLALGQKGARTHDRVSFACSTCLVLSWCLDQALVSFIADSESPTTPWATKSVSRWCWCLLAWILRLQRLIVRRLTLRKAGGRMLQRDDNQVAGAWPLGHWNWATGTRNCQELPTQFRKVNQNNQTRCLTLLCLCC